MTREVDPETVLLPKLISYLQRLLSYNVFVNFNFTYLRKNGEKRTTLISDRH